MEVMGVRKRCGASWRGVGMLGTGGFMRMQRRIILRWNVVLYFMFFCGLVVEFFAEGGEFCHAFFLPLEEGADWLEGCGGLLWCEWVAGFCYHGGWDEF